MNDVNNKSFIAIIMFIIQHPIVAVNKLKNKFYAQIKNIYKLYIIKDDFAIARRDWLCCDGDNTLRYNYSLNSESIVFDIGGYVGDFTKQINDQYGSSVYLFEPVDEFYQICLNRFKDNQKIKCYNFALSDNDDEFYISVNKDSTSIVNQNQGLRKEKIIVKSFAKFIHDLEIKNIDLLKVNIEGGEYDLMPHIIESKLILSLKYIQIQFHKYIPNADKKRSEIIDNLSYTHNLDWCYKFIWESWSIIEK